MSFGQSPRIAPARPSSRVSARSPNPSSRPTSPFLSPTPNTLKPRRSLTDLYRASSSLQSAVWQDAAAPFDRVAQTTRITKAISQATLRPRPTGPTSRPASVYVSSSRELPPPSRSSTPAHDQLRRSTSSSSSVASFARPTAASSSRAAHSRPSSPVSKPALARISTAPGSSRPVPIARSPNLGPNARGRDSQTLGISNRRPRQMARSASPAPTEGYASMEQVRPDRDTILSLQMLATSGFSETRVITPTAKKMVDLAPIPSKTVARKPSLIALGISNIITGIWPSSPPAVDPGRLHAEMDDLRRHSLDDSRQSSSNEARSSSAEEGDTLAEMDMTIDDDAETELVKARQARAYDWVSRTPFPDDVIGSKHLDREASSTSTDASSRSATSSERAPYTPASKASPVIGRSAALEVPVTVHASHENGAKRLAQALRHVTSESRLRAEAAQDRLPGPRLLHRAASQLTIRPAMPVLSPTLPTAQVLPIFYDESPPSPAHHAKVLKRPSPKRAPILIPLGAHQIDFGNASPARPKYDGFVLVRGFDEPGLATFEIERSTPKPALDKASSATASLRGVLDRNLRTRPGGIVAPKGVSQRVVLAQRGVN